MLALRLSGPRRAQPRQWHLRARQWPRRRGGADLVARALALPRGRRDDGHGGAAAASCWQRRSRRTTSSGISPSISRPSTRSPSIVARWRCARGATAGCTRSRCRSNHLRCRRRRTPRASSPRAIAAGLDRLPWSKAQKQWRDRVMFLRKAEGDEWPDLTDDGLIAQRDDWLVPALYDKIALDDISRRRSLRRADGAVALGHARAARSRGADAFRGADRQRARDRLRGRAGADHRGAGSGVVRADPIRRSPPARCRWCWNCCRRRIARCR